SCGECHSDAACLKLEQRGDTYPTTTTFSCLCKDGFVGDGINCYDVKECGGGDSSCCGEGYMWSSKQGCVDIDECSLTPSPCGPSQLCRNTQGSFECLENTTPESKSSQFWCKYGICPHGMDCFMDNGQARCGDPCEHYTVLDEEWRATDNKNTQDKCDGNEKWQGWYRFFLNGTDALIPERCVEENMCGTQRPMFLSTPHPTHSNFIERRDICVHHRSKCCSYKSPSIHVKRCYGRYYIYRLVKPKGCYSAYCAEGGDALSQGRKQLLTLAICFVDHDSEIQVDHFICGQDKILLTLNRANVLSSGLDPLSGHLVDRSCTRSRVESKIVWYEVETRGEVCGNTRRTNSTHVIYTNSLFLYAHNNNSFHVPASLPFSCVYPLAVDTSLNAHLRPLRPTGGIIASGGPPKALMSLYQDASYQSAYQPGNVSLPVGQPLYIGVSVEENDPNFVTVLEECYITYTANPNDQLRHPLIHKKCSANRQQVQVVESGTSLWARFSALFFVPEGQYRTVYVHCHLNMCSAGPCVPLCSGRARRSVSEDVAIRPLTIGPITWGTK
ncbi:hypothetical protein NQD34_000369, partial [Periophthalmus magnuspinnatus]